MWCADIEHGTPGTFRARGLEVFWRCTCGQGGQLVISEPVEAIMLAHDVPGKPPTVRVWRNGTGEEGR